MSVNSLFDGTPKWFQRFVIPPIIGAMIAVPISIGWADNINRIEDIDKGLEMLAERIEKLEKREDTNRLMVQGIVTKQARMDGKLDLIIQMMEREAQ